MTDEHARIEELLSAMQDGAVTPEEAALVQRHLATCAQCRSTATAFEQIDRQVRRYLMATPVPEMASPWRNEPLVAVAPRRRSGAGHWRITTVGLTVVFALLFAATALTFFQRNPDQDGPEVAQGTTAPAQAFAATATRESAASLSAPAASSAAAASAAPAPAAAGAAAPTTARAAAASAAAASARPPAAPASAAAAASTAGAAASAAASTAASARPSAAASAAAASAAATAPSPVIAPPATAPATTPTPAAADSAVVNPTLAYRLNTATALTVCRPACDQQAQSPDVLRQVVAALDQPLPLAPPASPAPVVLPYVTLRFTLADGQLVDIGYYLQINQLQLPDGRPHVAAPPAFVAALAGAVAPR